MIYDAIVIGSGAAGYSTADWLYKYGIKNIAVVTEDRLSGTSRNTGSDKQTYYKLSLDGANKDSAKQLAEDIALGGSCDGELAYIEAVNSARCFYRLVEYGVDFPTDPYGGYAGYKTDHDSRKRATSVGPLTSKQMTEKLEHKVLNINKTPLIDNCLVISIIVDNKRARGVLVYDKTDKRIKKILAGAVIAASGAPAAIYGRRVYPASQHGMTGMLIRAGAKLVNFSEWQYGLASLKFRWNVSGSYMQVVPRVISIDAEGAEREFLAERLGSETANNLLFLKGYQWPFDSNKINGSSKIDIEVQKEIESGRRIYLDYTRNPSEWNINKLSKEAKEYLVNSGAQEGLPIDRLLKLNYKAIKLYADNGIDIVSEPLEIAVCAQHNNGGVMVDNYYQTDVEGLFAVGEVAGVFGVTRQGGTALNSTQVGGLRVALYLKDNTTELPIGGDYDELVIKEQERLDSIIIDNKLNYNLLWTKISLYAGFLRDGDKIKKLLHEVEKASEESNHRAMSAEQFYIDSDALLTAKCLLKSILQTMDLTGSRGGALYIKSGLIIPEDKAYRNFRAVYDGKKTSFIPVKPVPEVDFWFETLLSNKAYKE